MLNEGRRIVMDRIYQLVCDIQLHWCALDALKVASPPVAIVSLCRSIAIDALHKDEPVRIGGENGVAAALRCRFPVHILLATAPAGRRTWLIVEIGSYNHGVIFVVACQHLPV